MELICKQVTLVATLLRFSIEPDAHDGAAATTKSVGR